MLVANLHVRGEGGKAEHEEEDGQHPLQPLEPLAARIQVLAFEPAPLHRQSIEA
jgi:hypothetical protein